MTTLTPYLLFDGNCREAMEFYKSCLGGELNVTKVKDTPAQDHMPAFQHDKVINARLKSDNLEIPRRTGWFSAKRRFAATPLASI